MNEVTFQGKERRLMRLSWEQRRKVIKMDSGNSQNMYNFKTQEEGFTVLIFGFCVCVCVFFFFFFFLFDVAEHHRRALGRKVAWHIFRNIATIAMERKKIWMRGVKNSIWKERWFILNLPMRDWWKKNHGTILEFRLKQMNRWCH